MSSDEAEFRWRAGGMDYGNAPRIEGGVLAGRNAPPVGKTVEGGLIPARTGELLDPLADAGIRRAGVTVVATRDAVWDARAYLVSSESDAVLIDGNGNLAPLLQHADAEGLQIHAALLTHTHEDHVAGIRELRSNGIEVLAHAAAPGCFHDRGLDRGEHIRFGALELDAIALPGHDAAQLGYRAGGVIATGDSIYRRTVAGHSEPSEVSFVRHMRGIRDGILSLPAATGILPGHGPATTVRVEAASNPFVRAFTGVGTLPPPRACRVGGPFGLWEAELLLLAPDYDGGHKALVRFPTIGRSIVPGSQIYTMDGEPWLHE